MEIHNQQNDAFRVRRDRAADPLEGLHRAPDRPQAQPRETEGTGLRGGDRLEISVEAREIAEQAEQIREARRARIEELKTLAQEGQLNTLERMERAAHRMLGGE